MFIDEHRSASGSSRSAGPWRCRPPPTTSGRRATARRAEIADERLLAEIKLIHAGNYEAYGSRRTWKELERRGDRVSPAARSSG